MSGAAAPDSIATRTPATATPRPATGRLEDGRFVQLRRDSVASFCQASQLGALPRLVLRELLELVDWRTATMACTQTDIADYLGLLGGHGRRQLGEALAALQAAGAIECHWSRGRTGSVTVTVYDQLVRRQTVPTTEAVRAPLHLVAPTPPPLPDRDARPTPPAARTNDRIRANDQPKRDVDVDEDKIQPPNPPGGGGELRQHPQQVTDAVAELVARERAVNVTPVRNPGGWDRRVRDRLLAEHGEHLLELVFAKPHLSAAELADAVAPPAKPTSPPVRVAESRPHAARCPDCDDQHVVELPPDATNVYGTVGPCPLCRPSAPTPSAAPLRPAGAPISGPSRPRPDGRGTEPQPIRLLLEAATTRKAPI